MVRTADDITSLEDMNGASICVQSGTTTELNLADSFRALSLEFTPVVFEDANQTSRPTTTAAATASPPTSRASRRERIGLQTPDDHVILDVTMSKEPLAPAVLQGDPQWTRYRELGGLWPDHGRGVRHHAGERRYLRQQAKTRRSAACWASRANLARAWASTTTSWSM